MAYLRQAAETIAGARPTTRSRMALICDGCLKAAEATLAEGRADVVLLEQIRTIDKRRLREHMGHADESVMNQVDSAIAVSFGLTGI